MQLISIVNIKVTIISTTINMIGIQSETYFARQNIFDKAKPYEKVYYNVYLYEEFLNTFLYVKFVLRRLRRKTCLKHTKQLFEQTSINIHRSITMRSDLTRNRTRDLLFSKRFLRTRTIYQYFQRYKSTFHFVLWLVVLSRKRDIQKMLVI